MVPRSTLHPYLRNINASVPKAAESSLTRLSCPPELDIARGNVGGVAVFHRFGYNPSVGTTAEDVWSAGGTYAWPTTAETLRIAAGGNAADDAAGLGARSVWVQYLDADWVEQTEELATAGASASAVTSKTAVRLNRAWVGDSGAYGAANTGDIAIENSTSAQTVGHILAAAGQTQQTMYTVPAAKTAYLLGIRVHGDLNRATDTVLWQRRDADDVVAPFTSPRIVWQAGEAEGAFGVDYECFPSFPANTDIWCSASVDASTGVTNVDYDLLLVDD